MVDSTQSDEEGVLPSQMPVGGPMFFAQEDAPLYLIAIEDAAGAIKRCAVPRDAEELSELVSALAWFDDPAGVRSIEAATIPLTFTTACRALRLDPIEHRDALLVQCALWRQSGGGHKHWSRVGLTRVVAAE